MANNLTDSLIKVLDNGGKEYAGAAKTETEDSIKKFSKLILESFPKGMNFKQTKGLSYSNATTKKGNKAGQAIKKWFWVPFKEEKHKNDSGISISGFLFKIGNKHYIRLSIEMEVQPGTRSKKQNINLTKNRFNERVQYDKILSSKLGAGLSYFYNGKFQTNIDDDIRKKFLADPKEESHIEIVKKIELDGNDDTKLSEEIKDGINALIPIYESIDINSISQGPYKLTEEKEEEEEKSASTPSTEPLSNIPLNIILFGAPGTGKTYSTITLSENILKGLTNLSSIIEPSNAKSRETYVKEFEEDKKNGYISFVTFHQSYGYESFIEGIKPFLGDGFVDDSNAASGKDSKLQYIGFNGVFKSFCKKAKNDPTHHPYVFIIDEINRGNISKIFGELITLIEESKRFGKPEALSAILPDSKETFTVPDNVYIVGTMNTADRSIALIDTALRRRFSFIEMEPNYDLLSENVQGINIKKLLKIINSRIEYLYDKEHVIGHSYFIGLENETQPLNKLKDIFKNSVLPLLQEYFVDDYEKISLVLGDNQKEQYIDRKANKLDEFLFVVKKENDYENLFGKDIEELDIDTDEIKYELNKNIAYDNPKTYIAIYEPEALKETDQKETDQNEQE